MMRLFLSDQDEAAITGLADQCKDHYFSFRNIAGFGVPRHDTRRVVRKLARMGMAEFASGLANDDGEFRGSGYRLTDYGRTVAAMLKARNGGSHE